MASTIYSGKCTLVPSDFYKDDCARDYLAQVVDILPSDAVKSVFLPRFDAWMIYAAAKNDPDGSLPELHHILTSLDVCTDYNKILCSWNEGVLNMAIAQGSTLLIANSFNAADFTTAEYFIFQALKSLQLNPEVSTISWMNELDPEQEMSLYRYFKAVEQI